ncbi:MAG: prolipoprotein diacylglyceryl transferase [Selenomonadaceae bacterium]|nr:prolipoprotein diacylglyceryl transferase [Selenomonadaceae bacterium]
MYPYIHITLPSYGVMAFLGVFAALCFLYFRFEKYNLAFNDFIKLFLLCGFTCFFFSKLLYFLVMLFSPEFEKSENILVLFIQSGYVFYGGLFGVLFGVWCYQKKYPKTNLHLLHHMITPALPLFHGFGRIGCQLAGCCYGAPLENPIVFFGVLKMNLFPTQLLEALYEFFLFVALYFIGRKYNGDLLRIYLVCYAVFRFFIEFFRADPDRGIWLGFSTAQWISCAIVIFYVVRFMSNLIKNRFERRKYE